MKKIIVLIVHNYQLVVQEIRSLEKEFEVKHFFDPEGAKELITTNKEKIFCIILDQAYIYKDHDTKERYKEYLKLKEALLKNVNVIVTKFLPNDGDNINQESKLVGKDVFIEWSEIFEGEIEVNKLMKQTFPITE